MAIKLLTFGGKVTSHLSKKACEFGVESCKLSVRLRQRAGLYCIPDRIRETGEGATLRAEHIDIWGSGACRSVYWPSLMLSTLYL